MAENENEKADDAGDKPKRRVPLMLPIVMLYALLMTVGVMGLGYKVLIQDPSADSGGKQGSGGSGVDLPDYYYQLEGLTLSYTGPSGASNPLLLLDVALRTTGHDAEHKLAVLDNLKPKVKERLQMKMLTKTRSEIDDPSDLEALKGEFKEEINRLLLGADESGDGFIEEVVIEKLLFSSR